MKLSSLPIARQLALAVFSVSLLAFSGLLLVISTMSNSSSMRQTEIQLSQQMTAIAISLEDSFASAKEMSDIRMDIFKRVLGGKPKVTSATAPAGKMPAVQVMFVDGLALNNNLELLNRAQQIIGADPAVMVLHDGKFVRVATLLKDAAGNSQVGVPLPPDGRESMTLKEGKSYIGLVTRNGKYYMVNYEPVLDDKGQVAGAIAVRVSIDSIIQRLSDNIKQVKVGETGYPFVFIPGESIGDAQMMAHPTLAGKRVSEVGNELLNNVIKQMIELKNGTFYYDWVDSRTDKSGQKIAAVATVKSAGWIVGAGSWVDEFTEEARALRNATAAAVVGCALLIIGIVTWLANARLSSIGQMAAVVKRMGNGDLTHEFAASRAHSVCEMDVLGASLSSMQHGMKEMIATIRKSVSSLSVSVNVLNESSQQVSKGSQLQSDSSSSLAASIEQLSVSINHVSENAAEANRLTTEAASASREGRLQVETVVQRMLQIQNEISGTATKVSQLSNRTAEISGVVQIIKDVADQTNLLALNAAIEAARAGEQGRGFAVVADEVRKLAERTTLSTTKIATVVDAIQSETESLNSLFAQLTKEAQMGALSAESAGGALSAIELQSEQAMAAVSGIADSTREQGIASHEIARGVETISQMAEGNSAAACGNLQEAIRLREMASTLDAVVRNFKT